MKEKNKNIIENTLGVLAVMGLSCMVCCKSETNEVRKELESVASGEIRWESRAYSGVLTDLDHDGQFDVLKIERKYLPSYGSNEPTSSCWVVPSVMSRSYAVRESEAIHVVDRDFFTQYERLFHLVDWGKSIE